MDDPGSCMSGLSLFERYSSCAINGEKKCAGLLQIDCIFCIVKEVLYIRCGWLPLHFFWDIIKHIFNMFYHQ